MANQGETEVCYEVKNSEELGRYLIARRDINALEVVICEKPLVCAPADDPQYESLGNIPTCLGCFARLPSNFNPKCSKCGWPVCDTECETIIHHAKNECLLFQSNAIPFETLPFKHLVNETIFILRSLFLKKNNPKAWVDVVLKFEHHTETRMSKPDCVDKDKEVIANLLEIRKHCSTDSWLNVNKEEIIYISGIINVNAFSSTKLEDECRSRRVRRRVTICQCLYPTASLLAHQCVPNASWTISASPHFEQTIRTTVPIKKGEMISIAYATREVMWSTLQRLVSTNEVAHFICQCFRCVDKTELGTFIGAVKCPECRDPETGYLLPEHPTDPESIWLCQNQSCKSERSVQEIVKRLNRIERQFDRIKGTAHSSEEEVSELEDLYTESKDKYLHKNHYLLLEISLRIVNRNAFSFYCLDAEDIDRYLFHCFSLLQMMDILNPGYCRIRAIVQFYASQALMVKARKQTTSGQDKTTSTARRCEIYRPIYKLQKEAYLYFKTEDENDNRHRTVKGCNQYVACLVEEMESSLKCMQISNSR